MQITSFLHSAAAKAASSATPAQLPTPPEENRKKTVLSVDNAAYWQEAKPLCPINQTLLKPTLQQPQVLRHFGQALAQAHSKADILGQTPPPYTLKTVKEAQGNGQELNALSTPQERAQYDIPGLGDLCQRLSDEVTSRAPTRIYTDYNWYPQTISCAEDGTITSEPDHTATGYHAWFEPLCRLDFTGRGTVSSLKSFFEAYAKEREDESIQASGFETVLMGRQLFNILYFRYFLRAAGEAPQSGGEKDISRQNALANVAALRERIFADNDVLSQHKLPALLADIETKAAA